MMTEQDEWVFFRDIEFDCPKHNKFNVDTRDFHCGYTYKKKPHPDINVLKKYPERYFHTQEELIACLERLFQESGGQGEWRHLFLTSGDPRTEGWQLKYLRIFRHDGLFIICNADDRALTKDLLTCPVNQEYLNHH